MRRGIAAPAPVVAWPRAALVAIALGALPGAVAAQATTASPPASGRCDDAQRTPASVGLRLDNDLFGGPQDQNYTNGVQIDLRSPDLAGPDDPCLPAPGRLAAGLLGWLSPAGYDKVNLLASFGQQMYTPAALARRTLVVNDRPYAAMLGTSIGYAGRNQTDMVVSRLYVGVLGPAAGGSLQNTYHRLIGQPRARGWSNQLHNEPVLDLYHERLHRWQPTQLAPGGLRWDVISHYGGALGNAFTHANGGFEVRLGRWLPDDFGSTPVRVAGIDPVHSAPREPGGHDVHLFGSVDVKWVLRDITLDGNTFTDSHRVDRRAIVGEFGYGIAARFGRWKLAFARYHRTREFFGQTDRPVYGSITASREF